MEQQLCESVTTPQLAYDGIGVFSFGLSEEDLGRA